MPASFLPEVPVKDRLVARIFTGGIKPISELKVGDIYQQEDANGELVPFDDCVIHDGMAFSGGTFPDDYYAKVEEPPKANTFSGKGWFVTVTIARLDRLRS